jgi:hypothetical protein
MKCGKLAVTAILCSMWCGPLLAQPASSSYGAPTPELYHYRQTHKPHPHTKHHTKRHYNAHKAHKR